MIVSFVIAFAMYAGMRAGMGLPGACCDRDLMGFPNIFAGAMIIVGFGISVIVGLVAVYILQYKDESCGGVEALVMKLFFN